MMPRTRTASTRVRRVRRFGPPLLLLALCAVAPIPIASFAGGQRRRFATKSSSSSSSSGHEQEQQDQEQEEEVVAKSAKELAADASSAEFGREVRYSSDLKALLPTRKMRFMKLDKFGRRIQRMEDDGTVNMMKEPSADSRHTPLLPTPSSAALAALAALGEDDTTGIETEEDGSMPQQQQQPVFVSSPSLATLLGEREKRSESSGKMNGDAILDEGDRRSVDLKGLLPKQKMRFMKLDKFGRRVQRMEDDGTVNMMKEPSAAVRLEEAAAEEGEPRSDEAQRDANDGSDDESAKQPKTTSNYGSLKDLLPTRRATWTKLDVKGASVADERRTNKSKPEVDLGNNVVVSGNTERSSLKDLLPQKAMWTKLDFHGVSIVDERRMPNRAANNAANDDGAGGGYSNLKTLLPERTVTWKNARVLQGAGGGSTRNAGDDARGRREERRRAAREEVVASVAASSSAGTDDEDDDASQDDRDEVTGSSSRTYANLKDLLPERKMTWR